MAERNTSRLSLEAPEAVDEFQELPPRRSVSFVRPRIHGEPVLVSEDGGSAVERPRAFSRAAVNALGVEGVSVRFSVRVPDSSTRRMAAPQAPPVR